MITLLIKKELCILKKIFNIHINTIYNWINKYHYNDQFDFSSYKSSFKYNYTKINDDIEMFIINFIDNNNNFNIKKIKNNIKNKFTISLYKSSIYHVLHKNNLTHKKIYIKNIHHCDNKIIQMKKELKNKINNIGTNKFISYDVVSIYLNSKPQLY